MTCHDLDAGLRGHGGIAGGKNACLLGFDEGIPDGQ